MPSWLSPRRPRTWLIAGGVVVLLVAVVAPWVYINFIKEDAPDRLAFDASGSTSTSGSTDTATDPTDATDATDPTDSPSGDGIEGTWTVTQPSEAGYRVGEVLFGQDTEAAGRTTDVTGEMTIAGTTIEAASFTVDMTTVSSDESRRDGQFRDRIMDVVNHPTATFTLTEAIVLDGVPAELEEVTVSATGDFTIRGVTRPVTFDLLARRNGANIELNGAIPVVFADFEIPDASGGPATVKDNGEIEFLLTLARS